MYGVARGIWFSVFHSISAFCNAGFDLMGEDAPMSSLTSFSDDALVIVPVMLLITIGGLGFFTWHDILENKWRVHHYRLQTKLVLLTSALLIVIPSLYFFFYEFAQPQWSCLLYTSCSSERNQNERRRHAAFVFFVFPLDRSIPIWVY